jgi:hypothetical protein
MSIGGLAIKFYLRWDWSPRRKWPLSLKLLVYQKSELEKVAFFARHLSLLKDDIFLYAAPSYINIVLENQ